MKKVLLSTSTGVLTFALLLTCPLLNTHSDARSVRQVVLRTASSTTDPVTYTSPVKPAVVARTNATESVAAKDKTETASVAKPKMQKDKKTMGRCWKRLMNNLREIRYAHKKN